MITKMLELSTAHITPQTADYLYEQSRKSLRGRDLDALEEDADLIVYEKGEYGYFIPIYDLLQQRLVEHGDRIPADLQTVLGFAMAAYTLAEVTWVMFDRDCDERSDLPTYNW